jgi:small-conductance mechanosensitive channel
LPYLTTIFRAISSALPAIIFALWVGFAALTPGVTGLSVTAAFAQTDERQNPTDFEEVRQLTEVLRSAEREIDSIVERLDQEPTESFLTSARIELLQLVLQTETVFNDADARINTLTERLDQMGPSPSDGAVESDFVANERAELNAERAALTALRTQASDLTSRANENIEKIAEIRREAFTTQLTTRSEIGVPLFTSVVQDSIDLGSRIVQRVSSWVRFKLVGNPAPFILSIVFAFAAAFVFRKGKQSLRLSESREEWSTFNKLVRAFLSTIVPSLFLALVISVFLTSLFAFGLLPRTIRVVIVPAAIAFIGVYFVYRLARSTFSPDRHRRRIFEISDYTARRLTWFVVAMAALFGLNYFATTLTRAFSTPPSLILAIGFITAISVAGLIIAITMIHRPVEGRPYVIPAWARYPLLIIALALAGSALLGYLGLAQFLSRQIVVTGSIIATLYLGLTTARALGEEGQFADTSLGKRIQRRFDLEDMRLDQIGVGFSLLISFALVLTALPAILLQWGSQIEDIRSWAWQAFSGFRIGSINLSILNILIGIGVFVVALICTRLFQRWLSKNVLRTTHADTGVRDSIVAGVGYAGFALAVILGVTTAGVNLASLAVIAGALSLGIGFGLQNIVSNFVSGLILLVERPIKVGDFVDVGGTRGSVRKISVRATEIHTIHNQTIIMPNSEFINSAVGNWTHRFRSGRADLSIGVSYSADVEQVREILLKIADDHPEVLAKPAPYVYFEGFGASSLDFQLRVHVRDYAMHPRVQTDIFFEVVREFREADIEIPFPQRDLNIRTLDDEVSEKIGKSLTRGTTKKPARAKPAAKK